MPDFVATYKLAGALPDKWDTELREHAKAAGVEVLSSVPLGQQKCIITIRVPASTAGSAAGIAGSFLGDAVLVLSGPAPSERAQLLSLTASSPGAITTMQRIVVALSAMIVVVISWQIELAEQFPSFRALTAAVLAGIAVNALHLAFRKADPESTASAERTQQAIQERALVQQIAGNEDPTARARLELARVSLRIRASTMRGDANRLWQRSLWASRGAFFFFLLAAIGPGVAAWLLLNATSPDWHFLFGGMGLSVVPLTIGTALLRHDTKLREQYKEVARDVAALERYELALDYSRIESQPTYEATIQKVITQLLALPPAAAPVAASAAAKDGESDAALLKIVDGLKDTAVALIQKKGA